MSSSKETTPRKPRVARKIPRNPEKVLTFATSVVRAAEANPTMFPAAPVATLKVDAATLGNAISIAAGKDRAAIKARNAAAGAVHQDLVQYSGYVQELVNAVLPEQGVVLITTSQFAVSRVGQRSPKAESSATHGDVSGSVVLEVAAIERMVMIFWEMSVDQKAWTRAVEADRLTATVTGLTPGQTYYFRFRAWIRASGYGNYSQAVSLIAL